MPRLMRSLLLIACLAPLLLFGCGGEDAKWHSLDITGSMPPLAFTMQHAPDGKTVTGADYRGHIVLLYFGYTFCPDVCPTTLANLSAVLHRLGPEAAKVRVLFVTVDPRRDTLPVLGAYASNFSPQVEGLRGTPDALEKLARRYRVAYAVRPETKDHPYTVTHSSAIYVFDRNGTARLLMSSLDTGNAELAGATADLKRLIEEDRPEGVMSWLRRFI
jgi:protein SCO1/2